MLLDRLAFDSITFETSVVCVNSFVKSTFEPLSCAPAANKLNWLDKTAFALCK